MITHKKQVNWRLIAFPDNGLAARKRFPEGHPSRRSGIRFDPSALLSALAYSDPPLCLAGQNGFPQESLTGFGRSSTMIEEGVMGMSRLRALVRQLIVSVRQLGSSDRGRRGTGKAQPARPPSWRDYLDQAPRKRRFKIFE
jgi:hypothetical protein